MTDWTNARVVRQEDAGLFFRTEDPLVSALGSLWRDQQGALWSLRDMAAFAPLTPVLDADGLPVVRTVGDLTARHQLTRAMIRLDGSEGALRVVAPSDTGDGRVLVIWGNRWVTVAAGTPCEVLS